MMGDDQGPSVLGSLIITAIAGLPAALSKSMLGAMNRLVAGAVDVPATYLAGWKERLEDSNFEVRLLRRSLANAAVAKASEDTSLVDRTIDRLLIEQSLKQRNREGVAQEAAVHIASLKSFDAEPTDETILDDDWMNSFIRFSEDASSERLRSLFAKILAGEIISRHVFARDFACCK
jgi:hypothetical protein